MCVCVCVCACYATANQVFIHTNSRVLNIYTLSLGGDDGLHLPPSWHYDEGDADGRCSRQLQPYFLIKLALCSSPRTLSPVLILSNVVISIPAEVPTYSAAKCCRNGFSSEIRARGACLQVSPEDKRTSLLFWISVSLPCHMDFLFRERHGVKNEQAQNVYSVKTPWWRLFFLSCLPPYFSLHLLIVLPRSIPTNLSVLLGCTSRPTFLPVCYVPPWYVSLFNSFFSH